MEKYIVYDIDNHDLWSNVLLKNRHGFIERHVFMSDFINGNKTKKGVIAPRVAGAVNVGDKMYSLGRSQPFVLPAVWVCRGRLSFCIQPVSDYAIKEFVYKYFDAEDRFLFRIALFRALIGRGIIPTLSTESNLRLFLGRMR